MLKERRGKFMDKYDCINLDKNALHDGYLVLVNRHNPLRQEGKDYENGLAARRGLLLEKTCMQNLTALIEDIRATDKITGVSGFRSRQEQEKLYNDSLTENGELFTSRYVARPGQSEHETGLAVDLAVAGGDGDFIRPSFPNEGAGKSFRRLAARYGFIERYKEGKEHITGIAAEPWHFRYVGYPHAALMDSMGLCLEEYTEYLRWHPFEGKHLFHDMGEILAEIYYTPAYAATTTVPVLKDASYQVSGNNLDGFVITVFHTRRSEKGA